MNRSIILILLPVLLTVGCNSKRKLTLSTYLTGSIWHKNGVLIAEAMSKFGWEIEVYHGGDYISDVSAKHIETKKIDLAIIPNNRIINQGNVRAVAPLNQEAMLFFYRDDGQEYHSLKELVTGKRLLIPVHGSGQMGLISEVFSTFNIESDDFTRYNLDLQNLELSDNKWKNELDSIDVLISFSQLNNPLVKEIIGMGWKIYSLGDLRNLNQGSLIDALCIKYPWAFPLVIPERLFGNQQPLPIYTLGIQSLLIAHSDTDADMIYDFLTDFYAALPAMSQQNVVFARITENYDRSSISYSLHEGTLMYLDRDKPTFIERYAEFIALLVSLAVIATGIVNRFASKQKQDKKDFIDVYYDELLKAASLDELKSIRLKAINLMQDEKLRADDTFLIFLQLFEQRKNELS